MSEPAAGERLDPGALRRVAAAAYQLSGAIGGATAALVATAPLEVDDGASWPALYLAAMAAISAVSILLAPEFSCRRLDDVGAVPAAVVA